MSIQFQLSANAQAIVARLDGLPDAMKQGIAGALDEQNQLTIGHAQVNYLRGPRPQKLGVVTSRLRGSLSAAESRVSADRIVSTIGTNVAYAGIHEHGFNGPVQVPQHTRTNSRPAKATAGSVDLGTGRITRRPRPAGASSVTVRAHTRRMKMPARPFLQPAVADRLQDYGNAVSTAIESAWDGRS